MDDRPDGEVSREECWAWESVRFEEGDGGEGGGGEGGLMGEYAVAGGA